MSQGLVRYVELLAEHGWRAALPRETRHLGFRWRVSPDEALRVSRLPGIEAVTGGSADVIVSVLGLPYFVDDALPPNAVILEPRP